MPHGRDDAIRSAHGQRSQRRATTARLTRVRAESGSMSDYCKHMFDFSVHTAGQDNSTVQSGETPRKMVQRSRSEAGYSARSTCSSLRTNGPTPDGSILHNQKQRVLTDIRVRSQNDYNTHRASSRNSVQDTINEKNRQYRVRSVMKYDSQRGLANGTHMSTNGSEMLFIPMSQQTDTNLVYRHLPDSTRLESVPSVSDYMESESIATHDPFDDQDVRSIAISDDFRPTNHSSRPNSCLSTRTMLPPTTACSIRLVSLDEESPPETEDEEEPEAVEEKKPEPPPPQPPPSSKQTTK